MQSASRIRAFSSEPNAGSRRENATKQGCRAAFRFDWLGKCSSLTLLALATSLVVASVPFWRGAVAQAQDPERLLVTAVRLFDGTDLRTDAGVLLDGGKIVAVGPGGDLRGSADREMDLGDATILPGFIDLHTHVAFRQVSREAVLRHGITTVRDLGGPLLPPSGGAHLGLAPLGPGAPADIIAVRGNALENFKLLEYPALVVSGGRFVVNQFAE
jgi:hypothetical protein